MPAEPYQDKSAHFHKPDPSLTSLKPLGYEPSELPYLLYPAIDLLFCFRLASCRACHPWAVGVVLVNLIADGAVLHSRG